MQLLNATLLEGLNPQQREAVLATDGPVMVIAGAGSGKTRVITHRIAHLIENCHVRPEEILAVTFTNKAAREMRERVSALTGAEVREAWICTFHAMCVRILRADIDLLGYDPNFSIYDDSDQNALIKECLASLGKDAKEPAYYRTAIGRAKNRLLTPEALAEQATGSSERQVAQVYRLYQRKLREQNALDFDDLLLCTLRLLREHPEVLEVYQERFHYIMVDEYQDTNHLQYSLIRLLAEDHRNLCIVGDDFQSVYSFRLADISNILNFQRDYPDARVIKLEQNYRSSGNILEAANAVIANNTNQLKKRLWTEKSPGEPIRICGCPSERHEAQWVMNEILFLRQYYRLSDIAVLFRTNHQSRVFEEECIQYQIPYRLVGGLRYYDRKEVKDLLAYLRLIQNPHDSLSLQRIINIPRRGMGAMTLQKYAHYANEHGCSLFEALKNGEAAGVTGPPLQAMKVFTALVEEYHERQDVLSISELLEAIFVRFGYRSAFNPAREKDRERLENIDEFARLAAEYDRRRSDDGGLKRFLDYVSLLTDIDRDDEGADQVTLMTVHASKGLEFPVVFLVGMEEKIFPHERTLGDPLAIEEERRLFYVGITRAMERLYLTYAESRLRNGQPTPTLPSSFLDEIPIDCREDLHPI